MSVNTTNSKNTIINVNKPKDNSWIAKLPIKVTLVVAMITLITSVGVSLYSNDQMNQKRQKIAYVSDLKQLSEHIETSALQARSGSNEGFSELKSSSTEITKILQTLDVGGVLYENHPITPIEDDLSAQLNKVIGQWSQNKPLLDSLISQEMNITTLKANVVRAESQMQNLLDTTTAFQKLVQRNDSRNSLAAQEVFILSTRINQGLNTLFAGDSFSLDKGYALVKDLKVLNLLINSFKTGAPNYNIYQVTDMSSLKALYAIEKAYQPFATLAEAISPQIETINNAKEVSLQMSHSSKSIIAIANQMDQIYTKSLANLSKQSYLVLLLFMIGITCLGLVSWFFFDKEKKTKNIAIELEKSQNNQKAVDLLLDQIRPMSKGDFTRRVYVSDKFVTQIAEKVDNTREIFASIVLKIKNTAESILQNADITNETSKKLLEVSDMQYSQMESSIQKLTQITSEMDGVAQTTWLAQEESNQSKEASQEGRRLVSQSMSKMDEIRNNIQESSKKIKKSSESAQAISEVTALIQNITKQIEVLALNAAIQAASSGEAGREFTVVAKEVQRLAIDSKESTQQILELIKDVQEDIGIAVASMEKTTQEVVEGTKLTDNAGQALAKIETLSTNLAHRVAEASSKLEEKSSDMTKISLHMKELQNTTEKSKEIVQTTAQQMDDLKNISVELTNTVKNYKIEK